MIDSPQLHQSPIHLAEGVSRDYLLHHQVCPKTVTPDGALVLAVAPEAYPEAIADLKQAYGCEVVTEPAAREEVERLIERLTTNADRLLELSEDFESEADDLTADVRDLANQPPVIRYVNLLVRDAYDAGASDIHLESSRTGLNARFRMDGVLVPAPEPPANLHHAVVSRIKLLAELDIAERRRPQDGRIRVRLEARELDLRVSTIPTLFGESVVLRLLDRGGRPVELAELGLPDDILTTLSKLAARPHGMLLVTGPTGSGKTTTLYAALQRRNAGAEKIITVEDPVEYQLPGITQVPVHRQAGVTFASALRSILRQDPDVLMIGEMRDEETAEIAVQAAMTGHLVFSTLHTNDALSAIPRLLDLGVPPYLVAATLHGVMAQRLVRRICPSCTEWYSPGAEALQYLGGGGGASTEKVARGTGCAKCRGTGYQGRVGIFEMLVLTDDLRDAIAQKAPRAHIRDLAAQSGLRGMMHSGWDRVKQGVTTVEEVLRVLQT